MSNWPKCPKCHSQEVEIIELWENHSIEWVYGDRQEEGNLHNGDPYRVEGNCLNCGKRWKVCRVTQIQPEWFDE